MVRKSKVKVMVTLKKTCPIKNLERLTFDLMTSISLGVILYREASQEMTPSDIEVIRSKVNVMVTLNTKV